MNADAPNILSKYTKTSFNKDFKKSDKFMLYLLFFHWIIAVFITSHEFNTYIYGLINGGLIFIINLILYKYYKGTPLMRYSIAISLMLFSSIFIQQYLGRIEMHFHVFLAMALLTIYKDIYPIIIATATTAIHHALFNYFQLNDIYIFDTQIQIFNYGCGWDIVLLHAIFAITEGVILSFIVRMQIKSHLSLIESEYNLKEKIKLNKELSKEAEQFASALNESNIISKTDILGNITYVNQKFCDLSGYSEKELIGQQHNIIRSPDMLPEVFESMWETINSKKIFRALIKNLSKNGSPYYADSTIIPILNVDNEIQEFIGVRYDVTELVEAKDKAIKSQQAKDQFLANMSHELRTPLHSIIGFIKQADKKTVDEDVHKYLQTSLNSSTVLLDIINNILDISKIEDGKFSIEKNQFVLYDNLQNTLNVFELECNNKEISYINKLDINKNLNLNGDWQRISQIITNLISNAIKFTHKGGGITVKAEYKNGMFICSVTDTGIGLNEEAKNRIFKAFEQADSSTTREFGGTGLGLSISLQLAHMMNGNINLDSIMNKGSTFTLKIPLESISTTEIAESTTKSDKVDIDKLSGHILVAEDNKTNQILIKLILDDFGLTCDLANDGIEAVEMYNKHKYDLILMDESMPNMSGTEAMQTIRENHSNVVPIIVVTANTMKGSSEKYIKAGMDDFVPKPIDETLLYNTLKKYLN